MPFNNSLTKTPTKSEPKNLLRQIYADIIRPSQQKWIDRASPKVEFIPARRSGASYPYQPPRLLGGSFWTFIILIFVLVVLAHSYQPTRNFRSEPPSEFLALSVPANIDRQQWAREYWSCAKILRPKYTYGVPLPETPPAEFHIAEEKRLPRQTAEQVRLLYWKQLQKTWLNSSAWETKWTLRFK